MPTTKQFLLAIATFYIVILVLKALRARNSNPLDTLFAPRPRLGLDPYEVLEVPKHASIEEIKHAYQQKIKFYSDPKKLPSEAKQWQIVAKRKKLETQVAYKQLTGKTNPYFQQVLVEMKSKK